MQCLVKGWDDNVLPVVISCAQLFPSHFSVDGIKKFTSKMLKIAVKWLQYSDFGQNNGYIVKLDFFE